MTAVPANSYKNIMEVIVDEEIDRQTQDYSADLAQRLNRVELATYALNRLPPLYASSREGVDFQYERGSNILKEQVRSAVAQALKVLHKCPDRQTTPFILPEDHV